MKSPNILQNAKHEWSSVRVMKLLIVIAILIVWVHACWVSENGGMVPIHPSILALLLICMGIGSVEKWLEMAFGVSIPEIAKTTLKQALPSEKKTITEL